MIVAAACAAVALGAPSPAQASDASLRRTIRAQEKKVAVAAKDFAEVSPGVASAVGRERAKASVTELEAAVKRLRASASKEQATTAKVKRGRTQYLAALKRYVAGLTTFTEGLDAFDPDAPSTAEQLFKKATAQLKSAIAKRNAAAKLIGGLAA